jgi:starch synthase
MTEKKKPAPKTPKAPKPPVPAKAAAPTSMEKKPAAPRARKAPAPRAAKPAAGKAGKPAAGSGQRTAESGQRTAESEQRTAESGGLSILMVTSEAHPFAKTGGLAEVTGALPLALARLGHRVTLVVPRYREVDISGNNARRATLQFGDRRQDVAFVARPLAPGVTAILVDAPALYDRPGLYGQEGVDYEDNAWRFAVLSMAALEYARLTGERPSIIHAHDWQAGLVPVFQKMVMSDDPIVGGVPAVFTIHNLAFPGVFPASTLPAIGLGWDVFNMDALEYWGQISYLKGGVNFSERITTVSPTYAREILTEEHGFGFDGVLTRRAEALSGILNGIDYERWNPEADRYVPATFGVNDLSGKAAAKRALLEAVKLPVTDDSLRRPLIGLISRLTEQKGYDLMAAAASALMDFDATWVLLGSGEKQYEDGWRWLAGRIPDRVSTTIGFDERLAHLIEAGADMFLMPSQFEPCGLNQMYSHRYGTVPIVRATGGLIDTVHDASDGTRDPDGFTFREHTPAALVATVKRALAAYKKPQAWKQLQLAGMRLDHSWDASAREYVKVYEAARARP